MPGGEQSMWTGLSIYQNMHSSAMESRGQHVRGCLLAISVRLVLEASMGSLFMFSNLYHSAWTRIA